MSNTAATAKTISPAPAGGLAARALPILLLAVALATPAMAQTAAPAAGGGTSAMLLQMAPLVGLFALMYLFLLRPQQQRAKQHQAMVAALKRGDTVVLSSGVIGKVSKVEDTEVAVDIATGVSVKVVKAMITEVRVRGEPAPANDAKS